MEGLGVREVREVRGGVGSGSMTRFPRHLGEGLLQHGLACLFPCVLDRDKFGGPSLEATERRLDMKGPPRLERLAIAWWHQQKRRVRTDGEVEGEVEGRG